MSRKKQGTIVVSILLLATILLSACQQPYSTPPAATNTPLDTSSLFSTPLGEPDSMQDVENFITQTALAGEPGASIATATPAADGTLPADAPTATSTPIIDLIPTATATQAVAASTSQPTGPKPETYTLKKGEFPYCIARRFNVDPDQLLASSGLSAGVLYPPGTVLNIPQTGTFPDSRMLKNHPAAYTVASSDETVYGIACLFGDIDPSAIAQNNGISVDAALTAGQTLNIP